MESLHGTVVPLAGNLCRVTYDFSDPDQILDWSIASNTNTQLLGDQVMLVSYPANATDSLAAVQFKLPLRTTRLAFTASTLEGQSHMNAYLAVHWTGVWNPSFGYGCIHHGSGRMFTISGTLVNSSNTGLLMQHVYEVEIVMTATRISWTTDGSTDVYDSLALYQGKDRNLVLGGWESTVAFDNIVIEGEF